MQKQMNKRAAQYRPSVTAGVSMLFLACLCHSAMATPSGLNNIPTADVVPEQTLVLQGFVNLADNTRPDWWGGLKYGPLKNLEVGFDGQINPESSSTGALVGQFKYRVELQENTSIAVGVANIGEKKRSGEIDYYAVLSQDIGSFRVHLGGTLQRDNEGAFGGLDSTLSLFERDLTLRADLRQINERDDLLASVGFLYDLGGNFLLETWGSFPSTSGSEDILTLKLNYVIAF
jgi:hypothetical protein